MARPIAILAGLILYGLTAFSHAEDRAAALEAAVEQARTNPTPETVSQALDLCYRNDAWRDGVALADEHAGIGRTVDARRARALWRAGRLEEAIGLTARITDDGPIAQALRVKAAAASGDRAGLRHGLAALERIRPWTPETAQALMAGRLALNDLSGLATGLEAVLADIEPLDGYPADSMKEYLQGIPEYFAAMEGVRLNEPRRHGQAALRSAAFAGLALCEVEINGSGPYRLIVDTGGSVVISLDTAIAGELELRSIAPAQIRGVNGVQESGQCTLEKVRIGEIELANVMGRTFDMPAALRGVADGVLGTGVFAGTRMTLDFTSGVLKIESSGGDDPGDAVEVPCWLMGDRKLFTRFEVNGRSLMAIVDTGADVIAMCPQWMQAHLDRDQLQSSRVAMAGGVGETVESQRLWFGPPVDVDWGGRRFADTAVVGLDVFETILGPVLGAQTEALIGMPLLRHADALIVDFGKARMWLRWRAAGEVGS